MQGRFRPQLTGIHHHVSLWRLLPAALRFPLRGYALPIILVFSLLFALGTASITGIVAFAIAVSWPMKYAYHVLERAIQGHFDPPPMTAELVNPASQQPLKHLTILLAMLTFCHWIDEQMGSAIALPLFISVLFVQPACAVAIATEEHLFAALNPGVWWNVIRSLGKDYLLVTAAVLVVGLLAVILVGQVPEVLWYAVLLYGVFAVFFLTGVMVYRHRAATGLAADISPEREQEIVLEETGTRLNRLLDEVYAFAKAERFEPAIDCLFTGLARLGDTLANNCYVHDNVLQWPTKPVGLRHGQHYVSLLMKTNRMADAVETYGRCMAVSDEFRVEEAGQVLRLARVAQTTHKPAIAMHILKGFELRFPNHPDCGAVARLRSELASLN